MPQTTRKPGIPAGYTDVVPSMADVKQPREAERILEKAGIEQFSDTAAGYISDLIETWCARNSAGADLELRFVLEQAKWAVGWKAVGRAFLDQLPEPR